MSVIFCRVPKYLRDPITEGPAFEVDDSYHLTPTNHAKVDADAFDGTYFSVSPTENEDAEDPLWELDGDGNWMPRHLPDPSAILQTETGESLLTESGEPILIEG